MPNWSRNRITMYENYELDSTDFYKNKEGKHAITDIYEQFVKDITVVNEEGKEYYNLMEVNPTPEILSMVHASSPPYILPVLWQVERNCQVPHVLASSRCHC